MNTNPRTAGGPGAGFVYTLLYLLTAVFAACLVFVSYQFEVRAYTALLGSFGAQKTFPDRDLTVAQLLALGLNGGKIVLIFVVVDALRRWQNRARAAKVLRVLVLVLSFLMTLLVFGGQTISPQAEAQLEADRDGIRNAHAATMEGLEADRERQADIITASHREEVERVRTAHASRLQELNALLDAERQIGGQDFKGARYVEIEDMITAEKTGAANRLDRLREEEQATLATLMEAFDDRAQTAKTRAQDALKALSFTDSFASHEAQNPYMLRAAAMVRTFSDVHADPVKVAIFLAAILCFAAELLPMVLFAHLFRVLGDSLLAPSAQTLHEDTVIASSNTANPPKTTRNVDTASDQSRTQRDQETDRRLNLGVVGERGR